MSSYRGKCWSIGVLAVVATAVWPVTAVVHATPGINWDAIAACESGGRWSADTGNGYYGGLQFSPGTWHANGGTGLPSQATREEQIRVAENIASHRGLGAWPHCGSSGGSGVATAAPVHKTVVAPANPAPVMMPSDPSRDNPAGDYTIQPGDTLSAIAGQLGVPGGWQHLMDLNKGYLTDPDLIFPGDRIATK